VSDAEIVAMLIKQAGINPPPEALERMVTVYPAVRAQVELLYACEEARYEDPVFTPLPAFADWGAEPTSSATS
jgi:hypothetical protein